MSRQVLGQQFGSGGATCDYPATATVLLGTPYDFGAMVGTLTPPTSFPPPTGDWPVQAASYEQILDAIHVQLMKYTGLDTDRVREWYSETRPTFGDDPVVTFRPTTENPFPNAGAGRIGSKAEFRIRVTIWYRYQSDDAGQHRLWGRQVLALRRAVVSALHDHNVYDAYDPVTGDPLSTALPLLYKVFQYVPSDTFGKEAVMADGRSDMEFVGGAVLMLHVPNLSS